jgi:hypothetical protein
MQSTAGEHDMAHVAAEPGAASDDIGRAEALGWASAARVVRHQVRDDLGTGRATLVDVLHRAHHDPFVGQVKLLWALESVPGARKVDTRRTLGALGIAEGVRLGALDAATTARLVAAFGPTGDEASAGPGQVAR